MAEFKTAKDYEARARYVMRNLVNNYLTLKIEGVKLNIGVTEEAVTLLSREYLDAYTDGVNDKCSGIYK